MNKTVQLVNAWAAYEEKHPHGSIEDFCRYHLIQQKEQHPPDLQKLTGGIQPMKPAALLMKIMGRIMRLNGLYSRLALEGTGVNQLEEFAMLLAIVELKHPRKSEVIHATIFELSTGMDVLGRLRDNGYITEVPDTEDRRSKRVKITAKGEKVLQRCFKRMEQLVTMMMKDMDREEILLCIQLLMNVEIQFAERWPVDKGRSFDEIYTSIMSE